MANEVTQEISKTIVITLVVICLLFVHSCEAKRPRKGFRAAVAQDTNWILRRRYPGYTEDNTSGFSLEAFDMEPKRPRRKMKKQPGKGGPRRDTNIILRRGDPTLLTENLDDFSSQDVMGQNTISKVARISPTTLPDSNMFIRSARPPIYTAMGMDTVQAVAKNERKNQKLPDANWYARSVESEPTDDVWFKNPLSINPESMVKANNGRDVLPDTNMHVRREESEPADEVLYEPLPINPGKKLFT
ncbi:uncharacterized protein LOC144444890 [Glandiceps talaboti]